ncbi:MAG TPA: HPF/RaiA family ribosome-associated protein [Candidatus Dormibacteraeota bacterium]|nr:HPF/RaiA family ribosome-associated protein [Candidatus Dormibacteraeota bacterium]
MRTIIRDRYGSASAPIRREIERGLAHLGRHLDLLVEAEVEFNQEARRSEKPIHVVEVTMRGTAPHLPSIRVTESGRDLAQVVDRVLETLDRGILKLKEQLKSHP